MTSRPSNAAGGRPDDGGSKFTGRLGWPPFAPGRQPRLAVKTDGERGGKFEILVLMGERAEEVMAERVGDVGLRRPAEASAGARRSVDQRAKIPDAMEGDEVAVMRRLGPLVAAAREDHEVFAVDVHRGVVPGATIAGADRDEAGETPIDHVF